jgi:hypothetical protein
MRQKGARSVALFGNRHSVPQASKKGSAIPLTLTGGREYKRTEWKKGVGEMA